MRKFWEWAGAEKNLPRHAREESTSWGRSVWEFFIVIVVALLVSSMVKTFLFQAFVIPSSSMENTLQIGDRIMVSKLYPRNYALQRGDIVVFEDSQNWLDRSQDNNPGILKKVLITVGFMPDDSHNYLVKRLIGLPGDTIEGDENKDLLINGQKVEESGIIKAGIPPNQIKFKVTVPPGHIWVMGDNRSNSADSRYHRKGAGGGFVPINDITGKAMVRIWPFARLGFFPKVHNYDLVPDPK